MLVSRHLNLGNIYCPLNALKYFCVLTRLAGLGTLCDDVLLSNAFQILLMYFHLH